MAKFLIEVPHEPDAMACTQAVHVLLTTGSHFVTNADWGCFDGDHTAWMIVNVETREEARLIVPQAYRAQARVVGLNRFSMDQIDALITRHGGRPTAPQAGIIEEVRLER